MKKDQTQHTPTEITARSTDIKESVERLPYLLRGEKNHPEIYHHMLRMAVTSDYLNGLDIQDLPEPGVAGSELLQRTADAFRAFNEVLAGKEGRTPGLDIPDRLASCQVAKLIQVFFHAVTVPVSEINVDEDIYGKYTVMVYADEKSAERCPSEYSDIGTYTTEYSPMVSWFCPQADGVEFYDLLSEVGFWLEIFAEKASV